MTLTRRRLLAGAAALALPLRAQGQGEVVEIAMAGRGNGAHVWFDPVGLLVQPGQTVRWTNRDPANVHTATAYHPSNFGRPRRMPEAAAAWDSGYLMPDEHFEIALGEVGVYDYYCVPHEHAGMVGRIVVGGPGPDGWTGSGVDGGLPEVALNAFPPVDAILRQGIVRRL